MPSPGFSALAFAALAEAATTVRALAFPPARRLRPLAVRLGAARFLATLVLATRRLRFRDDRFNFATAFPSFFRLVFMYACE